MLVYPQISSCRLNDVDPQAWLAGVLARIVGYTVGRPDELFPWKWRKPETVSAA